MPNNIISKLIDFSERELKSENFDFLSVGVIDFNSATFEGFDLGSNPHDLPIFYDLASLTKPLTLSAYKLMNPDLFKNNEMDLLLNHRGGLPAWGRLSHDSWMDQISNYKIKEGETLYSDFGALRLMLEIEKAQKENLRDLVHGFWDKELLFWKDLPKDILCPVTGIRKGRPISSVVHDDNAFVLDRFCSHAGLFGTLNGFIHSIINLDKSYSLLEEMEKSFKNKSGRYLNGWDTVENQQTTLAGVGCSKKTFGHLGFTGTSLWIDLEKKLGIVILSNATKSFWYDKSGLNNIRRKLGSLVWNTIR